jgi:uncharacterized protein YfiM (DUF2279 family)
MRKHLKNAHIRVRAFGEWVVLDGRDKAMHFIAMAVFSFVFGLAYGTLVAALACGSMAMAKEIYDRKVKKEDVDLGDLTVDCAGIMAGIAIVFWARVAGLA